MLNIKQKEIAKLQEFADLREEGLKYSEHLLNNDVKNFIEFLRRNREESTESIKAAENYGMIKMDKAKALKILEDEYGQTVALIMKNIERLTSYSKYKQFLSQPTKSAKNI